MTPLLFDAYKASISLVQNTFKSWPIGPVTISDGKFGHLKFYCGDNIDFSDIASQNASLQNISNIGNLYSIRFSNEYLLDLASKHNQGFEYFQPNYDISESDCFGAINYALFKIDMYFNFQPDSFFESPQDYDNIWSLFCLNAYYNKTKKLILHAESYSKLLSKRLHFGQKLPLWLIKSSYISLSNILQNFVQID